MSTRHVNPFYHGAAWAFLFSAAIWPWAVIIPYIIGRAQS